MVRMENGDEKKSDVKPRKMTISMFLSALLKSMVS
jgi:hypothetical protein